MTIANSLEITATIVGADVIQNHPELYHYTDKKGLAGIVESNTLWATHYADLNDSTEIAHLRNVLREELISRFRPIVQRLRVRSQVDRAVKEAGGLVTVVSGLADDLISSLYQAAFEAADSDSEVSRTAGSAFICSLCTHTTEPYESKNGLLSQWRGYGRDGGYCLVFDTAKLAETLGSEYDVAAYTHLNLYAANYAFAGISLSDTYPELIATCERFVETALNGQPDLGTGIEQFFVAATTLKHRAFYEEREVRVVAIPTTPGFRTIVEEEHPDVTLAPPKKIRLLDRPIQPKRYIALFEAIDAQLPIKRVIVGPSHDQASRVAWAQRLCGGSVQVVASETPYKG